MLRLFGLFGIELEAPQKMTKFWLGKFHCHSPSTTILQIDSCYMGMWNPPLKWPKISSGESSWTDRHRRRLGIPRWHLSVQTLCRDGGTVSTWYASYSIGGVQWHQIRISEKETDYWILVGNFVEHRYERGAKCIGKAWKSKPS